jgi:DNA-binding Lrp family transcriptional regulator
MTIILAILGIGIFAIPSAILASAFSDQLRIERETLLNELREIMKDGTVSEEEQAFIDQEAKRLHVSPEEVDRLLEEIRREQELIAEHAGIPLERLIATPALALLRFRELAGQVQQIALMTDKDHMDALIADVSKTDTLERAVWTVVRDDPARGTAT